MEEACPARGPRGAGSLSCSQGWKKPVLLGVPGVLEACPVRGPRGGGSLSC